jgi:hypothetical protein
MKKYWRGAGFSGGPVPAKFMFLNGFALEC